MDTTFAIINNRTSKIFVIGNINIISSSSARITRIRNGAAQNIIINNLNSTGGRVANRTINLTRTIVININQTISGIVDFIR